MKRRKGIIQNSSSITYKDVEYPSAYIEMGDPIGRICIAPESLKQALTNDGLYDNNVPHEVEATDNQIACSVSDEEFHLSVRKIKKSREDCL